ncbi:MAG TPA: DUF1778 domain-containing protein [Gammaproteobacteria bacterium]|nr:DUF1778 domain-containing protein [Gammaproteobacteria bacterium]
MPSSTIKHKIENERLEARISAEKKYFLKYAADLVGRSLTDFVVNSAYEAATRVIKEHEQIRLSLKDRDVFIQSLLNPPLPSNALLRAAKKYKKDITSK